MKSGMLTPEGLVAAARDYVAGRATFADVYAVAVEIDPLLRARFPGSLADDIATAVLLGEAEERSGAQTQDETLREIAELLARERRAAG